jgi:hypothetical protein
MDEQIEFPDASLEIAAVHHPDAESTTLTLKPHCAATKGAFSVGVSSDRDNLVLQGDAIVKEQSCHS